MLTGILKQRIKGEYNMTYGWFDKDTDQWFDDDDSQWFPNVVPASGGSTTNDTGGSAGTVTSGVPEPSEI